MPPDRGFDTFTRMLAEEVGYAVQPENLARLRRVLHERAAAERGGDVDAYLGLLRAGSPEAARAWQDVLRELTIGESFFFRDMTQVRMLRETLLPRLIAARSRTRRLSLWSAGCSTGEEPYTLAILLRELLPSPEKWEVSILGTDLNEASLAQARRGEYTAWSLRGMPPAQRDEYFDSADGHFVLREPYRNMVRFLRSNLVKDPVPDPAKGLDGLDLIVCRNVFIYFDDETTGRVAQKLSNALAPGGYLVTGHAELQGHVIPTLHAHVLPGSVVYERTSGAPPRAERAAPARAPVAKTPRAPAAPPAPRAAAGPALDDAEEAYRRADYRDALHIAEAVLAREPEDPAALRLAAAAAANLGQHERAVRHCRRLLDVRPDDIEGGYLLAKLAQDRAEHDEARALLARLVEAQPDFVPAYLDLAWLEERHGDAARALVLRAEALKRLERLPAGTILSHYEGLTVDDLVAQLRRSPPKGGA